MEQTVCTAAFWRGGAKIDLYGLAPEEVRYLSVTGERCVKLSFLTEYPNLERLTLNGKFEGAEMLAKLPRLEWLSLWLSSPSDWNGISLQSLRGLDLRGERNGDVTPLMSGITYLHLEEMRKIEDITPLMTPAKHLQKLYLQSLPSLRVLPELEPFHDLYALKLYELHKLDDLSALSRSRLRYFAASLIADKLSGGALAKAVLDIPMLERAALRLVDRSERRYNAIYKAFSDARAAALLDDEISNMTTWLSL